MAQRHARRSEVLIPVPIDGNAPEAAFMCLNLLLEHGLGASDEFRNELTRTLTGTR